MQNFNSLIVNLLKLTRINKPIGIILLLIPAFGGLIVANNYNGNMWLVFFLGAIIMRSSGCIINDLLDQKFDKETTRAQNRPLAKKAITNKTALIFLLLLLNLGLLLLLQLNIKTIIYASLLVMPMIAIYPLAKRVTFYPQIFLAIVFNSPFLLALTASEVNINFIHFFCYLSLAIWTTVYDTIYAFQDLQDDIKNNVKSLTIKIYPYQKPILLILNFLQWFILLILPYYLTTVNLSLFYFAPILFAITYSSYMIRKLDFTNSQECSKAFSKQQIIGFLYLMIFANFAI